jgi:hypothetical protein
MAWHADYCMGSTKEIPRPVSSPFCPGVLFLSRQKHPTEWWLLYRWICNSSWITVPYPVRVVQRQNFSLGKEIADWWLQVYLSHCSMSWLYIAYISVSVAGLCWSLLESISVFAAGLCSSLLSFPVCFVYPVVFLFVAYLSLPASGFAAETRYAG